MKQNTQAEWNSINTRNRTVPVAETTKNRQTEWNLSRSGMEITKSRNGNYHKWEWNLSEAEWKCIKKSN